VVIARSHLLDGIVRRGRETGAPIHRHDDTIAGEASVRGKELAHWLATAAPAGVHCWNAETLVTLGGGHGAGGRCQELSLAAALTLESLEGRGTRVTLLAAGTDGRDGPTDAAGAIVDAGVPARIRTHGLDPAFHVVSHDAHRALDAAQALIRTGPTGTNAADVIIAIVSN